MDKARNNTRDNTAVARSAPSISIIFGAKATDDNVPVMATAVGNSNGSSNNNGNNDIGGNNSDTNGNNSGTEHNSVDESGNNSGNGNGDDDDNEGKDNGDGNINVDEDVGDVSTSTCTAGKNEYWLAPVMLLFKSMTSEIDEAVKYTGRGSTGKYNGVFPARYKGLMKPSEDPLSLFSEEIILSMEQFCMPHFLIWFPEAIHKRMYPYVRPKCPWHNATRCVCFSGWCDVPRRGHASER